MGAVCYHWPMGDVRAICVKCEGYGRDPNHSPRSESPTCPVCRGEGEVVVSFEQALIALLQDIWGELDRMNRDERP